MAQNPLSGYGDDDADLPGPPAVQPATPTPPRNDLGQFTSPAAPAAQPAAAPQHNPYMVARARALGIDAGQYTPDTLGPVLMAVEQAQVQAQISAKTPAAPAVQPAPEPGPDWGDDDQGNPITTEEQARKVYPKAIFNAIKNGHLVEKLAKQNEQLQQQLERQTHEQRQARLDAKVNRLLAARPDLFGADPSAAAPGTVEFNRKLAVVNHLNILHAQKAQTTLDADVAGALQIFGGAAPPPGGTTPPAPKTKPAAQQPDLAAAYRQAELARTTGRVGSMPVTRREFLIEMKRQELEANGSPVVASGGGDDDDDLPAPKV